MFFSPQSIDNGDFVVNFAAVFNATNCFIIKVKKK